MADTHTYYPDGLNANPGTVTFVGKFTTAGAADPTTKSGAGVSSIVYSATGLYTLTLQGRLLEVLSAVVKIAGADTSNDDAVWIEASDAISAGTGNTCVIATQSVAGTAAALTGPVVHYHIVCRVTGVTK